MNEEDKTSDVVEAEIDVNRIPTTTNLVDVHQEGSFLVGRTELGVTFKHRIPAGKVLNKNEKGDWILQDLRISA